MSDPTFATQMVTKIKQLLLQAPGVDKITIDGQSVAVRDLKEELEYWERREREENGTSGKVVSVNLSSAVR